MSPTITQVEQVAVLEDFCTRRKTDPHLISQQRGKVCLVKSPADSCKDIQEPETHIKASHALRNEKMSMSKSHRES